MVDGVDGWDDQSRGEQNTNGERKHGICRTKVSHGGCEWLQMLNTRGKNSREDMQDYKAASHREKECCKNLEDGEKSEEGALHCEVHPES